MSRQTKDTLKSFFNAGDKPTETQFSDLIDSILVKLDTEQSNLSQTITTTGQIGIGTTSPTAELDVDGEISIGGGEAADEARLTFRASDESKRWVIETDLSTITSSDLLGFSGIFQPDILVLKGNGRVGIKTNNPQATLDVNGNLKVNDSTTLSTDSVSTIPLTIETPTQKTIFYDDSDTPGFLRIRGRDSANTKGVIFSGDNDTPNVLISGSGQVSIGHPSTAKNLDQIQGELSGSVHGNAPISLFVNGSMVIGNHSDANNRVGARLFIGDRKGSFRTYTTPNGGVSREGDRTFTTSSFEINPGFTPADANVAGNIAADGVAFQGEGEYNFKVTFMDKHTKSYVRSVLLLHEAYTGSADIQQNSFGNDGGYRNLGDSATNVPGSTTEFTIGRNLCSGVFVSHRGQHSGNNRIFRLNVHSSAGYEGNRAICDSMEDMAFTTDAYAMTNTRGSATGSGEGLSASSRHGRLVTCLFKDRLHVGYELPFSNAGMVDAMVFYGVHTSTSPYALQVIPYAENLEAINASDSVQPVSADGILNAEIFNSIRTYGHDTVANSNVTRETLSNKLVNAHQTLFRSDFHIVDQTGSKHVKFNQEGSQIIFSALPTSDPGTAGQLYNDGGTLKISAG